MEITFKIEELTLIYGVIAGSKEHLFFVKMAPEWQPYMLENIHNWVVRVRPLVGTYFVVERKRVEEHDSTEMFAWGMQIADERIKQYLKENRGINSET